VLSAELTCIGDIGIAYIANKVTLLGATDSSASACSAQLAAALLFLRLELS